MYDLLFTGAKVVDGTGNPWFWADVAIQGDKVVAVGKVEGRARREVEAAGRLLTPGFIDAHSHSDASLLVDPAAESKVRQGVTTEVIGNCGFSLAPLTEVARHLIAREVQELEVELGWSSLGGYLAALRRSGTAVNVVPLVGQGTVRRCVLGEEDRKPTSEELAEMIGLVEQALAEGAHGLSTGLVYPPGCFTETEELIALCRPLREAGGVYTSHIRDEGDGLVEAVTEAIEVGVKAGVPVHLSHHKAAGPSNWGRVEVTLRMLEEARSKGQDVTCDVYPYTAASTGLSALLPHWVLAGGEQEMVWRLSSLAVAEKIGQEVAEEVSKRGGWGRIVLAHLRPPDHALVGLTVEEAARSRGLAEWELVRELLMRQGKEAEMVRFLMCEEDVAAVLRSPYSMIGSDAMARSPRGVLGRGKPHPRSYGAFPRVLGRYVRAGVLTLPEAVRKMTSFPAARFGLQGRGLIAAGFFADLVLVDPDRLEDCADYQEPHRFPQGVDWVVVNGVPVVEEGVQQEVLPGRVL